MGLRRTLAVGSGGIEVPLVVIVSRDQQICSAAQDLLVASQFRLYGGDDPAGLPVWAASSAAENANLGLTVHVNRSDAVLDVLDKAGIRYWLALVGLSLGDVDAASLKRAHRAFTDPAEAFDGALARALSDWRHTEVMRVVCLAFGYRHGVPSEIDWVVDARFLDSPYWVDGLRKLPGTSPLVREHLMALPKARLFCDRFTDLLAELLPLYRAQKRSQIKVGFGCTGGLHSSVVLAQEVCRRLQRISGVEASFEARDLAD